MKHIYKQALNQSVVGQLDYIASENLQIRALTVHNPTTNNIECVVAVNGNAFIKKTITPNSTEVLSGLFNQHVGKDEAMTFTGDGLNVLMSVVEIVE